MSDVSHHQGRPLNAAELALLEALLPSTQKHLFALQNCLVTEMDDGAMGSLSFVDTSREQRSLGRTISKAEYLDADGVMVSITVNLDDKNRLYEIDFWKVDFSPLARYPAANELKNIERF